MASTPLLLKTQLSRFLIVGISAVATDFLTYQLFFLFLSHAPAKTLSFICGTVIAYFFNKYWTFEQTEKRVLEIPKFIMLYSGTLVVNVAVNTLVLTYFPPLFFLAFLCATGTSTVLNFIGQKWWIFK